MFCPKCGNSIEDGIQSCVNCGLDFSTLKHEKRESELVTNIITNNNEQHLNTSNPMIKFVYFGLAIIVLAMFFMAASSIADGGLEITQIQSVGGKTLEEAYYSELGKIYSGYAMISRALGIFFSSVLVWIGLKK